MAKRILPYRDYSEHDVVNLFALDVTGETLADFKSNGTGDFDAGVVVSVSAGALPGEVSELRATTPDNLRDYLGASFSGAHIGFNGYPANTGMTVAPANGSGRALGITLRETLAFDEHGEKMISYKQKLDEAQGVLPGQTVPVLTKGLFGQKIRDVLIDNRKPWPRKHLETLRLLLENGNCLKHSIPLHRHRWFQELLHLLFYPLL